MVFKTRSIVNGALLPRFVGMEVSIVIKVEECSGLLMKAKTTDGNSIRIKLNEPPDVCAGNWIEVVGTVIGSDYIEMKDVFTFQRSEHDFDEEAYNILVVLLRNCTDVFQMM